MDAAPTASRATPLALANRVDWGAVSAWALGFGLIALLGFNGGGFDPLVHDQVGIAVWWVVLAGALAGFLPLSRLGAPAWAALGLLAAFAAWTALSLTWTESAERTAADLARLAGYVGVFALALLVRRSGNGRHLLAAVGTAISLVALVGLLSRLHPAWFPEATQTGQFLPYTSHRLSYPLNYWNSLAALIAIGIPLLLHVATGARWVLARALAAGVLPALALTLFFTLARGGIGAAAVAVAVFLALAPDRLPKLLTTLVAGAGGAILVAAASQRDALEDGLLSAAARNQGDEMLAMTLVVCAGVAFVQAGISLALLHGLRPRWSVPSRGVSIGFAATAAVAALIALAAFDAPGRTADAWDEFKSAAPTGNATERLQSATGNGRYQYWASTVRENETEPLLGTGAATFEYWWARDGDIGGFVRDAHSLYMQTLGELGVVGIALLAAFFLFVLAEAGRRLARASREARPLLAAALAGCLALLVAAAFDWYWQIPVLPVALLLLASVLVAGGEASGTERGMGRPARGGLALLSLAAIVAIAVPLASTTLVRQSQADIRAGQPAAALEAARNAQQVQPGAAAPRLQQALILEQQGNLAAAEAAALAATRREPTNWRVWFTLQRIEAAAGKAADAVRHYRRARSLSPFSEAFD